MTPIELVESDDDQAKRGEPKSVSSSDRGAKELYGKPQHECDHRRTEQKEAFYGEPQHEQLEECLWGEPFPWLLDDDEERRPPTRSSTEIPLRRLDRKRVTTRR